MLFDFHHHHKNPDYKGVYNKSIYEEFSPEFYSIGLHPQDISDNWESEIEKSTYCSKKLQTACP